MLNSSVLLAVLDLEKNSEDTVVLVCVPPRAVSSLCTQEDKSQPMLMVHKVCRYAGMTAQAASPFIKLAVCSRSNSRIL